jgi:hypothetical protein
MAGFEPGPSITEADAMTTIFLQKIFWRKSQFCFGRKGAFHSK